MDNLIKSKTSNIPHSKEDIEYIVNSYTRGIISDKQMTRWLKAVCLNGMDSKETINYTDAIINSGERVKFKNIDGFIIDKHSTGGVGDKVSLILGPILAACGCYVPMIVGRTLAHTGGTLDKLESIPGYDGLLKINNFKKIVKQVGISIIGQTDEICPADKKIYNLRDKSDTIDSFPLICGSIIGKKIAEGIEGLVLDIKTGNGAFMKTEKDALFLGSLLKKIGEEYAIRVQFSITDMNQPLGDYSGLLCEIIESMETLKGNGAEDLLEVVYHLGSISLKMAGLDNSKTRIDEVINNGSAYEILCKMIYAHGGLLKEIKLNPQEVQFIKSEEEGYISYIDTEKLGLAVNALSIKKKNKKIISDRQAGFQMFKKKGAYIKKGESIARIFSSDTGKLKIAEEIFKKSISVTNKKVVQDKLIIR